MLQYLPSFFGRMLKSLRSDVTKIVYNDLVFRNVPESIKVSSPSFKDGGLLPAKYTSDGKGISPPLEWHNMPAGSQSVVLIIEDVDSPTRMPLIHLIVLNLPVKDGQLPEGAVTSSIFKKYHHFGRNSFLSTKYIPPDPPPGHGRHHYIFQLFALDKFLRLSGVPSKKTVKDAMRNHMMAKGFLTAVYER